jgi:hypothetical protein
MQDYALGQVLYVLLKKEATVYPMLVAEIQSKKTLEGEVTLYMLRVGQDATKMIAIGEVDGEIFDSSDKAKAMLLERVTATINARVDEAITKAREWYPSGREQPSDDPMAMIKKSMTVTEQAEARKPAPKQKGALKPELAALDAELRAEADGMPMMELPNGQKVKVRSVKLPNDPS